MVHRCWHVDLHRGRDKRWATPRPRPPRLLEEGKKQQHGPQAARALHHPCADAARAHAAAAALYGLPNIARPVIQRT